MERFFIFLCDGMIYSLLVLVYYGCLFVCSNPNDSPWHRYPDNSTCLHQATSVETAANLIRRGTDVNAQTDWGETPLHHLLRYHYEGFDLERLQVIQILILNGAEVNVQDRNGKTPLHIFFEGDRDKHPVSQEILLTLLRAGADIHLKDNQGKSSLDCAPNDATRMFMLLWESTPYAEDFQKMLSL